MNSILRNSLVLLCTSLSITSLGTTAKAQFGPPVSIPIPPATPARFVPGAPTILVSPGQVQIVATGQTFTQYNGCISGPIPNALAYALRLTQPGDVIGVTGSHPKVEIVANYSDCKANEAGWPGGAVVTDVSIVGLDATATVAGIMISGDYTQAGKGGVDRITLQDLTIRADSNSRAALESNEKGRQGKIRVYDCVIPQGDPTKYFGFGMKFGMRLFLADSLDLRGNSLPDGALEHFMYIDSPGFNGGYSEAFIIKDNDQGSPSGRTGLQLVNRVYPAFHTDPNYMGAPGGGLGLIRDNTFTIDASLPSGGGSAITLVGHCGAIWVERNHATYKADAVSGGALDSGGLVAWTSVGNNETWVCQSGYTHDALYVIDNTFVSTPVNPGTRACVSVTGSQFTWIGENTFLGAGDAIFLDSPDGGPIYNDKVKLPHPTMRGFFQGGCKVKIQKLRTGVLKCLTDSQILAPKYQ